MAKFTLSDGSVIRLSDSLSVDEQLDTIDGLERDFANDVEVGTQAKFDEAIAESSNNAIEPKSESGDMSRGFSTAFKQVPQLGYGLEAIAGATGESLLGEGGIATDMRKQGVEGYKAASKDIEADSKPTDALSYSWEQAKQGDVGALADWLQYGLGYAGGQGVQMLATAGFGSLLAKGGVGLAAKGLTEKLVAEETAKLAAKEELVNLSEQKLTKMATENVARKIGSMGATSATGATAFGMEGGEIGGDLAVKANDENRTLTGEELAKGFGATLMAGGAEFAGDMLGLKLLKGGMFEAGKYTDGLKGKLARGGAAAIPGLVGEGATEYYQTLVEEQGKGNDPYSDKSLEQAFDAAGLGMVGGGGMAIGGGLLSSSQKKPNDTQPASPLDDTTAPEGTTPLGETIKADESMADNTPLNDNLGNLNALIQANIGALEHQKEVTKAITDESGIFDDSVDVDDTIKTLEAVTDLTLKNHALTHAGDSIVEHEQTQADIRNAQAQQALADEQAKLNELTATQSTADKQAQDDAAHIDETNKLDEWINAGAALHGNVLEVDGQKRPVGKSQLSYVKDKIKSRDEQTDTTDNTGQGIYGDNIADSSPSDSNISNNDNSASVNSALQEKIDEKTINSVENPIQDLQGDEEASAVNQFAPTHTLDLNNTPVTLKQDSDGVNYFEDAEGFTYDESEPHEAITRQIDDAAVSSQSPELSADTTGQANAAPVQSEVQTGNVTPFASYEEAVKAFVDSLDESRRKTTLYVLNANNNTSEKARAYFEDQSNPIGVSNINKDFAVFLGKVAPTEKENAPEISTENKSVNNSSQPLEIDEPFVRGLQEKGEIVATQSNPVFGVKGWQSKDGRLKVEHDYAKFLGGGVGDDRFTVSVDGNVVGVFEDGKVPEGTYPKEHAIKLTEDYFKGNIPDKTVTQKNNAPEISTDSEVVSKNEITENEPRFSGITEEDNPNYDVKFASKSKNKKIAEAAYQKRINEVFSTPKEAFDYAMSKTSGLSNFGIVALSSLNTPTNTNYDGGYKVDFNDDMPNDKDGFITEGHVATKVTRYDAATKTVAKITTKEVKEQDGTLIYSKRHISDEYVPYVAPTKNETVTQGDVSNTENTPVDTNVNVRSDLYSDDVKSVIDGTTKLSDYAKSKGFNSELEVDDATLDHIYRSTKLRSVQDAAIKTLSNKAAGATSNEPAKQSNAETDNIAKVSEHIFNNAKVFKDVVNGVKQENTKFITQSQLDKLVAKANKALGTNVSSGDILQHNIIHGYADGIGISKQEKNIPASTKERYDVKLVAPTVISTQENQQPTAQTSSGNEGVSRGTSEHDDYFTPEFKKWWDGLSARQQTDEYKKADIIPPTGSLSGELVKIPSNMLPNNGLHKRLVDSFNDTNSPGNKHINGDMSKNEGKIDTLAPAKSLNEFRDQLIENDVAVAPYGETVEIIKFVNNSYGYSVTDDDGTMKYGQPTVGWNNLEAVREAVEQFRPYFEQSEKQGDAQSKPDFTAAIDNKAIDNLSEANLNKVADILGVKKAEPKADLAQSEKDEIRKHRRSRVEDLIQGLVINNALKAVPEKKVNILPIMVDIMEDTFKLGYLSFKDVARDVIAEIKSISEDAAKLLTIGDLKAGYLHATNFGELEGSTADKDVLAFKTIADLYDGEEAEKETPVSKEQKPNKKWFTPEEFARLDALVEQLYQPAKTNVANDIRRLKSETSELDALLGLRTNQDLLYRQHPAQSDLLGEILDGANVPSREVLAAKFNANDFNAKPQDFEKDSKATEKSESKSPNDEAISDANKAKEYLEKGKTLWFRTYTTALKLTSPEQVKVGKDGLYIARGKSWDYAAPDLVKTMLNQAETEKPTSKYTLISRYVTPTGKTAMQIESFTMHDGTVTFRYSGEYGAGSLGYESMLRNVKETKQHHKKMKLAEGVEFESYDNGDSKTDSVTSAVSDTEDKAEAKPTQDNESKIISKLVDAAESIKNKLIAGSSVDGVAIDDNNVSDTRIKLYNNKKKGWGYSFGGTKVPTFYIAKGAEFGLSKLWTKEEAAQKAVTHLLELRSSLGLNDAVLSEKEKEIINVVSFDKFRKELDKRANNKDQDNAISESKSVPTENTTPDNADTIGNRPSKPLDAGMEGNSPSTNQGGSVRGTVQRATDADSNSTNGQLDESPKRDGETSTRGLGQSTDDAFEITDDSGVGEGVSFKNNVEAIRLLKQLESENRAATPEEAKVFAKYTGWGGLKGAFNPSDKRNATLRDLLDENEYAAASASMLNAHYTAPVVVKSMYKMIERLGFEGGRVLEPSVGIGNFFGLMPKQMRQGSQLRGVELDSVTARMAQRIYPNAVITNTGFQNYNAGIHDYFDLAIGNPPFGSTPLNDSKEVIFHEDSKYNGKAAPYSGDSIHNYFVGKMLDQTREGGFVTLVISNAFMDRADSKMREYVARHADFIGGVRLPNDAFKKNAGTEVVTDILIFQKTAPKDGDVTMPDWVKSTAMEIANSKTGETAVASVNNYFQKNKQNVLGKQTADGTMYQGNSYAVVSNGENIETGLNRFVNSLPEKIYQPVERSIEEIDGADAVIPQGIRAGNYYVDDAGNIRFRKGDIAGVSRAPTIDLPAAKAERMKAMIALRDMFKKQMHLEKSDADVDEIEDNRIALNNAYDDFVKKYTALNSTYNKSIFVDDIESQLLLALEFDYKKGVSKEAAKKNGTQPSPDEVVKADILNRRVHFPAPKDLKVETGKDALVASLNTKGNVSMEYMMQAYGKTQEEIESELGTLIFDDPVNGLVDRDTYLSGDVKTKLDEAKAFAKENPKYRVNVDELEKVIPVDKKPSEIFAPIGAHWIPQNVYQSFLAKISGIDGASFSYLNESGRWLIGEQSATRGDDVLRLGEYGTQKLPAERIFSMLMDSKPVEVKETVVDYVNGQKTVKTIVNEELTEAAKEKADKIKNLWAQWLYEDADRALMLSDIYNEKYNRIVNRKYDGSHLQLFGKSPVIELRAHQKDAIWRAIQDRNSLLDHVVGAGKTFAMAGMAMEFKRLGIARKPIFIVPNHLTVQWKGEFLRLYPSANVFAATPADFSKEKRELFFSRIAANEFDAVIIGHSSLTKIGVNPEIEQRIIQDQINEITTSIEAIKSERGDRGVIKQMEQIKMNLDAKMAKINEKIGKRDQAVTFDSLGIDAMFVDELHEFKNLFFTTQKTGVSGMGNPAGSGKAFDLFVKTRWLKETYGEKAPLITATGTPVSNSLAEMFTMQRYMQYEQLKRLNIHVFDSWARLYGEDEYVYEVAPSGVGYRISQRFSKYRNLPSLMSGYLSFADIITLDNLKQQAKDEGKVFPVPRIEGGRPAMIVAPRSDLQTKFYGTYQLERNDDGDIKWKVENPSDYTIEENDEGKFALKSEVTGRAIGTYATKEEAQQTLVEQAISPISNIDPDSILGKFERLKQLTRETNGRVNALSLTSLANKAALDYRIIDENAVDFEDSKINKAVEQMMRVYKKWTADKGTQIVFCDMSTPLSQRAKVSTKESVAYVRDSSNENVVAIKATYHTIADFEAYPFFIAKVKVGNVNRFKLFDAVTGQAMGDGAFDSKASAISFMSDTFKDDAKMQSYLDKRGELEPLTDDLILETRASENFKYGDAIDEGTIGEILPSEVEGYSGTGGFSVYDDIKAKLIKNGVPEKEIAFIHDYDTPKQKQDLFAKVKRGEVRFLFGSTPKLGAGTNVQDRLVGLHHIDATWRPSDMEQREGRILRQGNLLYARDPEGFEVFIGRYATEQTYDTRRWQLLEHKASGIQTLRNYNGENEIDDVGGSEAANAADMKAAASGNPLILEEVKLRNEVKSLDLLRRSIADSTYEAQRKVSQYQLRIRSDKGAIERLESLLDSISPEMDTKDTYAGFSINGKKITDKEQARNAITKAVNELAKNPKDNDSVVTLTYRGIPFEMSVFVGSWFSNNEYKQNQTIVRIISPAIKNWDAEYNHSEKPVPPEGVIAKMRNATDEDKINAIINGLKLDIKSYEKSIENYTQISKERFEKQDELDSLRERHAQVQRQLMKATALESVPPEDRAEFNKARNKRIEELKKAGYADAVEAVLGDGEQKNTDEDTTSDDDIISSLEASRNARASKQDSGFDMSTTYYHGTQGNIKEFKPSNQANGLIFFTTDPEYASTYAMEGGGYQSMTKAEAIADFEQFNKESNNSFDLKTGKVTNVVNFSKAIYDSIWNYGGINEDDDFKALPVNEKIKAVENHYADLISGGNIMPVRLKLGKTYPEKLTYKEAEKIGAQGFIDKGYDSVRVDEGNGKSSIAVVRSNQVRSVNAKFEDFETGDVLASKSQSAPTETHTTASFLSTAKSALDAKFGKGWFDRLWGTGSFEAISDAEAQRIVGSKSTIEAKYSKDGKIEAFYNPADDKVYFVPENISKDRDVAQLALHEIGVHMMRLGQDQEEFDSILADVKAKRESNPLIKAAYEEAKDADTKAEHMDEEALARLIDKHPELKLSQRFIAWFKKAVRGFAKRFKGADKLAFIKWANKLDEKDWVYLANSALRTAPENVGFKGDNDPNGGIRLNSDKKPLLAPNGKPSNLNAMQYAQVRTEKFKAWFGDWEAVARQNHWRSLIEKALTDNQWQSRAILAQGIDADPSGKLSETFGFNVVKQYLTPDDLRKTNKRHGEGNEKDSDQIGLSADDYVKAFEVLRNPETYKKTKSNNGKPSAEFGREFSDGTIVVAEVETAEDGAVSVKSVWKKVAGRIHAGATTYPNRTSDNTASGGIIHSDSLLVNTDSVSKVVDENGEPLVVYHGTNKTESDFYEFSHDKYKSGSGQNEGGKMFFFTPSFDSAKGYSFLAARNNGLEYDQENGWQEDKYERVIASFVNLRNPIEVESVDDQIASQFKRTKNNDGMIRYRWVAIDGDYDNFNDDNWKKEIAELGVDNPNQIKSATGNNGNFDVGNNDIRFSKSPSPANGGNGGRGNGNNSSNPIKPFATSGTVMPNGHFEIPKETTGDKIRAAIQNDLLRLKTFVDAIKNQGGIINDNNDFYQASSIAPNIAAASISDFKKRIVDPLFKRMADLGVTQDDVGLLAYAKHAQERNDAIQAINDRFKKNGGGSGMTDEQADEIIKGFQDEFGVKYRDLENLANDWQKITVATRDILEKSGDISPETAAQWRNTYNYYVPLKGFEEVDEDGNYRAGNGIGKGFSTTSKFSKRALGRESRAGQILENIERDLERAIIRASNLYVAKTLAQAIDDNPDSELWEKNVTPIQPVMGKAKPQYHLYYNGSYVATRDTLRDARRFRDSETDRTGQSKKEYTIKKEGGDPKVTSMIKPVDLNDEIVYFDNGKQVRIRVYDKSFTTAFNRLADEGLFEAFKAMSAFNRMQRHVLTTLYPAFIIANGFMVDPATAFYANTGRNGFKFATKAFKNSWQAAKALYQYETKGKADDPYWQDMIQQYRATGGSTGVAYVASIERKVDEFNKALARASDNPYDWKNKKWESATNLLYRVVDNKFFNMVETLGTVSEQAQRLSTYAQAREEGLSQQKAAVLSQNVTVNFGKRGEYGREIGATWLFSNAGIQGIDNFIDVVTKGEHKKQAQALLAASVAMGFMIAMLNGDDGDDDLIPETEKQRYIQIPLGNGTRLDFKLPYANSFFFDIGRAVYRTMAGGNKEKIAGKLMSSFFTNFMPLGNPMPNGYLDARDAIVAFSPQITKLFTMLATNRNAFGSDLMPESPFKEHQPDSEKAFRKTRGSLADDFAKSINRLTGGDEAKEGLISFSPESVKATISFMGGGFARTIFDTVDALYTGVKNPDELKVNQIPVVKNVIKSESIDDYRRRMYSQVDDIDKLHDEFKSYEKSHNKEALAELKKENSKLLSLSSSANAIKKQIKDLRDEQDIALKAGNTARLKSLETKERIALINFNKKYQAASN